MVQAEKAAPASLGGRCFFFGSLCSTSKKKKIEKLQNQATTQPTTLRRPRSPQALQRLWLRRQQPRPEALLWARA